MEKNEVFIQVQEVLRDIFDDQNVIVEYSTTAKDIDEWDSFTHLTIIDAIEKQFLIKFNFKELAEMKNVENIVDIVKSKL